MNRRFVNCPEELTYEWVDPETLRVGDWVVFHPRAEGGAIQSPRVDQWVVRPVVRRLQIGKQRAFLTQGDDAVVFDPLVLPDQIVGRAIRAGGRDCSRWYRRWPDVWRARVSCQKALWYHRLACLPESVWNQRKRRWQRRWKIPALFTKPRYEAAMAFLFGGKHARSSR